MKISIHWLRDYLGGEINSHTAGEALTHGGLPVEVFETHGDDEVFDVEVTSNRGDCLSHRGVARELAALLDLPFRENGDGNPAVPKLPPANTHAASPAGVSVNIEATDLCPHYTARTLTGVKVGPSPAWMSRRLEAVGIRSINNVVDITNYVMLELGQPLHAFDVDKLSVATSGGEPRIVVRTAREGESIVSIDGHKRSLTAGMLVITDAERPVALAGVMGGRDTEVSESTKRVLIESARFDALSVRKTARALSMKSDSSYRYERGIDPALALLASERASQLLCELAGATRAGGVAQAGHGAPIEPKVVSMRLARFKRLLGMDMPADRVVAALTRLGLAPTLRPAAKVDASESADGRSLQERGDHIDVIVPTHRLDLNIEVDLIEEAARVIGYDAIPVTDGIEIRLVPRSNDQKSIDKIRDALVAGGCFEAITVTFVADALARDFLPKAAASIPRADPAVRKADAGLRPSLIPSLLEAYRRNETSGASPGVGVRLFEIGSTFYNDSAGAVVETRKIGIVSGGDAASVSPNAALRDLRGVIESLLTSLDARKTIDVLPEAHNGYAPGGAGTIRWAGETVGELGLISPEVGKKLDLRSAGNVVAAEIDLAPLLAGAQHVPQLIPLPRFPAVRRDISLIVSEPVRYQQVEQIVRALALPDLEAIEFVTAYRGKPLDKGSKSITITLVFRSATTTLTSEQIETAVGRVIDSAKSQLGATLRV